MRSEKAVFFGYYLKYFPKTIDQLTNEQINAIIAGDAETAPEFKNFITKLSTSAELYIGINNGEQKSDSIYGDYKPLNPNASFEQILNQDLNKQAEVLSKLFGIKVSFDEEWARKAWINFPKRAEKLFLILPWQRIAPTYGEAVQKVLDLIKQTRSGAFYNYREGQLGPNQLRQSTKQVATFQKLSDEQKNQDILVVPAQFGIRHRGRSVLGAREAMSADECGLGAFAIGIMLLTHPERLKHYNDLWIDCAGDELALSAVSDFSRSPCFRFDDGEAGFGTHGVGDTSGRCGSASVCLPQD